MPNLRDDEIVRLLRLDIDAAEGVAEIESKDNADIYKYYRAKKLGNEVQGKSQFVSSDVFEVVEWLSPQLSEIFSEQNGIPDISPHGLEDRESAELMEELIRYQFYRQNKGDDLLVDIVQDALMYRPGAVIKWRWEKISNEEKNILNGVTDEEVEILSRDNNISITGYEITDEGYYDIELNRINVEYDGPRFELIPPWEFLRHPNYKEIEENPFVAHRKRVTLDYLRRKEKKNEYRNIDQVENSLSSEFNNDYSEQSIYNQDGLERIEDPVRDGKNGRKEVIIYECYVKIDIDNDGLLEDRIITICNGVVLKNVENVYTRPPFTVVKCIKDTHKFSGIPVAEFAKDLQRVNSFILRQTIDNIAQSNNSRKIIRSKDVNMADVMDNRPGVPIRVNDGVDVRTAIGEMGVQPVNNSVINFFGVLKEIGEQRTGVSKIFKSAGDSNNQTASGQANALAQAGSRIRKMARIMSIGLKDLFIGMILMNKKFLTEKTVIRLTNKEYVEILPDDLEGKFDTDVNVLIGANSKQQQLQNMMQLLSIGAQIQPLLQILDAENLTEIWKEIIRNQGYKDVERFLPASLKANNGVQGGVIEGVNGSVNGQANPLLNHPLQGQNINSINELAKGETDATLPEFQGSI